MSNIDKRGLREELSNPAIGNNAHLRKLALALLDELEAAEKRIAELEAPDWTGEVSDEELNAALQVHRLKVDGHSQLSDAFRSGFKYARRAAAGKGKAS